MNEVVLVFETEVGRAEREDKKGLRLDLSLFTNVVLFRHVIALNL